MPLHPLVCAHVTHSWHRLDYATLAWVLPIAIRDLVGSYSICFLWEYLLYDSPYAAKLAK